MSKQDESIHIKTNTNIFKSVQREREGQTEEGGNEDAQPMV